MESWILITLIGAAVFAVCNLLDKYIVTKLAAKPIIPILLYGIVEFVAGLLVYLCYIPEKMSFGHAAIGVLIGVLLMIIAILYFVAMQGEEVSRVMGLYFTYPLFTLIIAAITLKEIFTPIKYVGVIALVIGSILLSSNKPFALKKSKTFWIMILASVFVAATIVLQKYLMNYYGFWTVFAYSRIGVIFVMIPMLLYYYKDFLSMQKEGKAKIITASILSEVITVIAVLISLKAYSLGSASMVGALFALQPLFVLVFSVIISIAYPLSLNEDLTKKSIVFKLIAIAMIITGVVLVI